MFKTTIINTFPSEDDCEMFIMVLKQQWPKYKGSVPESTLDINLKSDSEYTELTVEDDGNGYPRDIISKIGEQLIVPYRDRLAPKTITYNWEVNQVLSLG